MVRSQIPELMDHPSVPAKTLQSFHRDLANLNRLLGNNRCVLERLQNNPPKSVLDIGCGEGALLAELRETLGISVRGIDLRVPDQNGHGIQITVADATKDLLPSSDVALCILTVHHLNEEQVIDLVRNVGRSSRRFIILDLVRHPLPFLLYSIFIRPLVSQLVMLDGQQSIRRAYTPKELRALVVKGISGTSAVFEHWVSPIYGKQVIDIRYGI